MWVLKVRSDDNLYRDFHSLGKYYCTCICMCVCVITWPTGWEWSLLCRLGLCWSTDTTFFISSKLGSEGTRSKKGGRYSSTIPKTIRKIKETTQCAVSSPKEEQQLNYHNNNFGCLIQWGEKMADCNVKYCKKTHYQPHE